MPDTAARRLKRQLATALALVAATLFACGEPEPPPKNFSNVLLITVDTLRPDYLSLNGYDRATSPAIDELLSQGYYFEKAVTPVARTTPALASLLTGTYPHRNGVRRLTDRLNDDVTTLAEALSEVGFQSLAVVTNQVLDRERGLDRGFDVYDVAADTRTARKTADVAIDFLPSIGIGAPAFVWVHFIDPHVPYHSDPDLAVRMDPDYTGRYRFNFGWLGEPGVPGSHQTYPDDLPKRIATHRNPLPEAVNEHIRRLYAADIRALDDEVGRLVAAARERFGDDLLIVFTADHGESLGEHDFYFDHGDYVYNAGTRVPLGFVLPPGHAYAGSGRCSGWVSLVDVAPTLFALLHVPVPPRMEQQLEGETLMACLYGALAKRPPVFSESGHSYYFEDVKRRRRNDVAGRLRSVTLDDWKLIWTPFAPDEEAWELYHLGRDPHETRNIYTPDHRMVAQLKQHLEVWMQRAKGGAETSPPISEKDVGALRSLGYVE
jgi:arylsulfatase A-like enzyme